MNLKEALQAAKQGNFVTNEHFSEDESLHYWNRKFYYEDGAIVPRYFLENEKFATEGEWSICIPVEKVDKERLHKVHIDSKGLMLYGRGYMECVKKI